MHVPRTDVAASRLPSGKVLVSGGYKGGAAGSHARADLGKVFNLELATSRFPASEAYEVKKSFAESVDRLRGCAALCRALELT